jgi:heat shock protein HslJ
MKKIILLGTLALSLVGCSAVSKKDPVKLNGKEFQLVNIYPEAEITLGFDDNRFYGFSGINRYFGEYQVGPGDEIKLINPAGTKMAGPQELMITEDEYMKTLIGAKKVQLSNKVLTITTEDGKNLEFKETK